MCHVILSLQNFEKWIANSRWSYLQRYHNNRKKRNEIGKWVEAECPVRAAFNSGFSVIWLFTGSVNRTFSAAASGCGFKSNHLLLIPVVLAVLDICASAFPWGLLGGKQVGQSQLCIPRREQLPSLNSLSALGTGSEKSLWDKHRT